MPVGETPPPYEGPSRATQSWNDSGQKVVQTQSHVTIQPGMQPGQNYDPRIRSQYANEPGVIHTTRPYNPVVGEPSAEAMRRHQESRERYPFLNLSAGEYVILEVHRHPIGMLAQIFISIIAIILLLSLMILYPSIAETVVEADMPSQAVVVPAILGLCGIIAVISYIAAWVYMRNTFFLTNESVIQELQFSLLSHKEQTVSLGSIEDVSYRRQGLLQVMFDYGSIRLSTEGEESTYRFHYVASPKQQTAILSNAVEAFKNGRPVDD